MWKTQQEDVRSILAQRAYYFECLLKRTNDPVCWTAEKLLEAKQVLHAARDRGYECSGTLALLASAIHKASYSNVTVD